MAPNCPSLIFLRHPWPSHPNWPLTPWHTLCSLLYILIPFSLDALLIPSFKTDNWLASVLHLSPDLPRTWWPSTNPRLSVSKIKSKPPWSGIAITIPQTMGVSMKPIKVPCKIQPEPRGTQSQLPRNKLNSLFFYISSQVKELKKNPSIDCIYLYHHRQTKATLWFLFVFSFLCLVASLPQPKAEILNCPSIEYKLYMNQCQIIPSKGASDIVHKFQQQEPKKQGWKTVVWHILLGQHSKFLIKSL